MPQLLRAGGISNRTRERNQAVLKIDSNGMASQIVSMLKANNLCKVEVEQRVSMYSLAGRASVGQKAKRAAVRKKRTLLKMTGVSTLYYMTMTHQSFIDYDGMRRMEDLQSEFDTRSEVSGSTSRDQEDSVFVEPYDFDKLPAHACAYCGIHEPECVVKCGAKDCNKWFCNAKDLS